MVDGQKHSYFESPRTYTKYRPDYDSNEIIECQETVVDRWQTVEDCDDPPAVAETNKQFAYDIKTYVLNHDGSCYSQIVEFTFDDEKTGHGYFYEFNRD